MRYAFFGTDEFSLGVLEELTKSGFKPSLIVTMPDAPKGRGRVLTPPPIKIWSGQNNVPILQPEKLDKDFCHKLSVMGYELFVVASYGKIIPKNILDLPKHKTLNVHPSLLPRLRGASPIQTAILSEETTGVSIMRLDEKMDHGPIVDQEVVEFPSWPIPATELEDKLAHEGGKLLAHILPDWIPGNIEEQEQDEDQATYTKKITKEEGLISLSDSGELNYRRFLAYQPWPGTYFFANKGGQEIRVLIKDATLENGKFNILKVLPEGKKEMSFSDFSRNYPLGHLASK